MHVIRLIDDVVDRRWQERESVMFVGIAAHLGRPRFAFNVRLDGDDWRRLAAWQLPEDEGAAREGVEDAENRRVAG